MSTLMATYTTTISRLPVLPSSARSSWRSSVAFKPSSTTKCRRPLTVTSALPEKERPATTAFNIPPTALLCPVPPPDGKERWDIKEDENGVTLWLQVPGVSVTDIEVTTTGDVLEIKRSSGKPAAADVHGVGAFHVRLLITSEYDGGNVTADLKQGMLEVRVPKDPQQKGKPVVLGAPPATDKKGAPSRGSAENRPTGPDKTNQRQGEVRQT